MTTWVIYSDADDLHVFCSDASYANAREGTGSLTASTGVTAAVAGQWNTASPRCYEAFFSFDTSSVDVGTPTTVELGLTLSATSPASLDIGVAEKGSAIAGDTSDFIAGSSLAGLDQFGTYSFASDSGDITISGPADVARSTDYALVVYGQDQSDNSAPTGTDFVTFYTSEQTGTADDPFLLIAIPSAAGSFLPFFV